MISKKYKLPIQLIKNKKSDLDLIFKKGVVKIFHSSLSFPRLGIIISKKNKKKAVERNQLKRLFFNSAKNYIKNIPNNDHLFILRGDIKEKIDFDEIFKKIKNV